MVSPRDISPEAVGLSDFLDWLVLYRRIALYEHTPRGRPTPLSTTVVGIHNVAQDFIDWRDREGEHERQDDAARAVPEQD